MAAAEDHVVWNGVSSASSRPPIPVFSRCVGGSPPLASVTQRFCHFHFRFWLIVDSLVCFFKSSQLLCWMWALCKVDGATGMNLQEIRLQKVSVIAQHLEGHVVDKKGRTRKRRHFVGAYLLDSDVGRLLGEASVACLINRSWRKEKKSSIDFHRFFQSLFWYRFVACVKWNRSYCRSNTVFDIKVSYVRRCTYRIRR